MSVATDRLEFAPPATPGLLRSLGLALLAHAALLSALTWGIQWKHEAQVLGFDAELWSALPVEAAPPAPALEPEPAPPEPVRPQPEPDPAPQQSDADIALEQEKLRLKQQEEDRLEKLKLEKLKLEKLKQEKQEQLKQEKLEQIKQDRIKDEKLKQAQADKLQQAAVEKKKAEQETLQIEAQREKNLARMAGMADATGAHTSAGTALRSSGPSAGYPGRIRARIKPNIVFTEDIAGNPTAEVEVRTSPDGTIVGRRLLKSSGNSAWDDAVIKAIDKTEVLPRDTDGSVPSALLLVFRPKD